MGYRTRNIACSIAAALSTFGCVSVFEGTSQDISIVTNPGDASCVFERLGAPIGTVPKTPGQLTVRKTKEDITIRCNKPGYHEGTYVNNSGVSATIAANIAVDLLFTAGISSIVDSATGADNKYEPVVNITLLPLTGPTAAVAPPVLPVAAQ
jgi:hypothetical protein